MQTVSPGGNERKKKKEVASPVTAIAEPADKHRSGFRRIGSSPTPEKDR